MPRDPRNLKPSELLRALNSTPLGTVLTERKLYADRMRAGAAIGADKTIDLLRYAGWLAKTRHVERSPEAESPADGAADSYERHKERARARQAEQSRASRDLGELPEPVNMQRREACRRDFKLFCETYFPNRFTLKWAPDHLIVLTMVVKVVLRGLLYALAMPRGSGKTSLFEVAALWAVLYGHRRFVGVIAASMNAAHALMRSIMMELDANPLLGEDFPEVCVPLRALEGRRNRCTGQHIDGVRTRMHWKNDVFVFPTVDRKRYPWAECSGAIIKVSGILGQVRGMKETGPDGFVYRPEVLLIDDPQTEASATSGPHIRRRMKVLHGDMLGMKGPGGKAMAAFAAVTVIAKDDVADRLLESPEWNGQRIAMVKKFPDNERLIERYAEARSDGLRNGDEGKAGNAFWKKHRKKLELGAEVYWPQRYDEGEISAVQHAINLKLRDEAAFWAEYQNQPLADDDSSALEALTAEQVEAKIVAAGGPKPGVVPAQAEALTAFIDVQRKILIWQVCAWWSGFSGHIVDYGCWPEQGTMQFSRRTARRTMAHRKPGANVEGQIYHALEQLTGELMARTWSTASGAQLSIDRGLIDAGWGKSRNTVYQFCGESPYKGVLSPSHGRGITASMKPLNEYRKEAGDKVGHHWRISRSDMGVRYVLYDTNIWKTFVADRIRQAHGDQGSVSICHATPARHQTLIDQLTSEYPIETVGRGRTVDEWKARPNRENDLWDCLVGCAVAASIAGVTTVGHKPLARKRKRVKLSELQRSKR